jgi:hypothetical protein
MDKNDATCNKETFTQVELEQFASNVVGSSRPVNTLLVYYLQSLHDTVLHKGGYEGNGILKSLENQIQNNGCRQDQSQQQIVYNLYRDLLAAEYKGVILINFSSGILTNSSSYGNYTTISNEETALCKRRILEKRTAFKEVIKDFPRELRKCDPLTQEEGKTFIREGNRIV